MNQLINIFTNMAVPELFLNREYTNELRLTKDDLPYYIHDRQASVPGWSVISLQELYPDPLKMYEYRFLELFGFAIKKDNSFFVHTSAEQMLYNPTSGLFHHPTPAAFAAFAAFVDKTVLAAYLGLNTFSLNAFPDSIALQNLDTDIKDIRLLLSSTIVE